ncbi:MAG: DNA double-strand break repair nuclease NurA [Candidatus Bathyarchaeota archaeon]|jgi:hypothetical protein|nr:MAG: DNA double-strand break repair nuclease NurA [Candidatus Bathyarchaeota archaeon]
MNSDTKSALTEMTRILTSYAQGGPAISIKEVKDELTVALAPSLANIIRLPKPKSCSARFFAVDCSTRTLKRANNWGIYLLRTSYATVEEKNVDWSFRERIRTIQGDPYVRRKVLQETRLQMESEMALDLVNLADENDYILLDGASYFGGGSRFNTVLYEKCKEKSINLLAVSKQSPKLHDEKGRDLIAATYMLAPRECWIYYPVKKANIHEHLYGDISIVKLCVDSPRAFRCDIMRYLAHCDIPELISPLCAISEDPRCLGYPVALWLAHDFSGVSEAKLLEYHTQVEEELARAGLLDLIRQEELACSFAGEVHGVRHLFSWELIDNV